MQKVEHRPLGPEDLPTLAALIGGMSDGEAQHRSIRAITEAYYDWMYFQNPLGRAIAWGGFVDGTLVSSFAVVPRRFRIDGETVVLGKTMDMFTDPAFQGRGLMRDLSEIVFDEAKTRGLTTLYVTPSRNSYPIFVEKLGFREEFSIHYRVRLLNPSEVLRSFMSIPILPHLAGAVFKVWDRMAYGSPTRGSGGGEILFQEAERFGPETDELWSRCQSYRVIQIRDAEYLNWRFVSNPDRYRIFQGWDASKLRGLIVLKITIRKGLRVGEVVDFLSPQDEAPCLEGMFRFAVSFFHDSGCVMVQSWVIHGSRQQEIFRKVGIHIPRGKMRLVLSPDSDFDLFYDGGAWLLTMGDGNDI